MEGETESEIKIERGKKGWGRRGEAEEKKIRNGRGEESRREKMGK